MPWESAFPEGFLARDGCLQGRRKGFAKAIAERPMDACRKRLADEGDGYEESEEDGGRRSAQRKDLRQSDHQGMRIASARCGFATHDERCSEAMRSRRFLACGAKEASRLGAGSSSAAAAAPGASQGALAGQGRGGFGDGAEPLPAGNLQRQRGQALGPGLSQEAALGKARLGSAGGCSEADGPAPAYERAESAADGSHPRPRRLGYALSDRAYAGESARGVATRSQRRSDASAEMQRSKPTAAAESKATGLSPQGPEQEVASLARCR